MCARVITVITLALAAIASGSDIQLSITIQPNKAIYMPGDNATIEIRYRNQGRRPVLFLPDPLVYPARAFKFENVLNGRSGAFLNYSQIDVDVEQWAKDVVKLSPGETYTHRLSIKVVGRLPREYGRPDRGLFVLFPVSAIELPGAGQYAITMRYDSVEHPVRRALQGDANLWEGKMSSKPVLARFGQ